MTNVFKILQFITEQGLDNTSWGVCPEDTMIGTYFGLQCWFPCKPEFLWIRLTEDEFIDLNQNDVDIMCTNFYHYHGHINGGPLEWLFCFELTK